MFSLVLHKCLFYILFCFIIVSTFIFVTGFKSQRATLSLPYEVRDGKQAPPCPARLVLCEMMGCNAFRQLFSTKRQLRS